MSTDTDTAKDQAKAQLDSIIAMVDRLEHARQCDGEDCDLSTSTVKGMWSGNGSFIDDRTAYHDEDAAFRAFDESPLSVLVRSGWYQPGYDAPEPAEYEILLCTGGPAVRIRGELGNDDEPETARLEYQDWGTPWTSYTHRWHPAYDTLLAYTRHLYYGG